MPRLLSLALWQRVGVRGRHLFIAVADRLHHNAFHALTFCLSISQEDRGEGNLSKQREKPFCHTT